MPARVRRVLAAALAVTALLFAGRWTAGALADRWWGGWFSPAAAAFLGDLAVLRLTLDAAGVLLAAAWFTGHLLVVHRAIGAVEVSRRVANLEIREVLTPRTLLWTAVALGLVLGFLAGADASADWPVLALAWQGVRLGVLEPVLGHDAGLYLAQLPAWEVLLRFAAVLAFGALLVVVLLYLLIGALGRVNGRPAINDHARRHLGWLLAGCALVLAWHFLLEPFRLVGESDALPGARMLRAATVVAPALAGTALMVAILGVAWAARPRHALLVAGWIVLGAATVVGSATVAALDEPGGAPAVDERTRAALERAAFGLPAPAGSLPGVEGRADSAAPPLPALWQTEALVRLGDADSLVTVAAEPAWVRAGGTARPAWLVLRLAPGGELALEAVADDRVTGVGGPLYYAPDDSVPTPATTPYLVLSARAVQPAARGVDLGPAAAGPVAGRLVRRLALAWALQEPRLLGELPEGARVAWERSPARRVRKLAPFAAWASPVPRVLGGRLVWLVDGYVTARHFPFVRRMPLGGTLVAYDRAGFLGVVEAESGATRVFLRPDGGPLAAAWAGLAGAVVEPWASAPVEVRRAAPYPAELFRLHARLVERPGLGMLVGGADSARRTPAVHEYAWVPGRGAPVRTAAYVRGTPPRHDALLVGDPAEGAPALALLEAELDDLPAPALLEQRWGRFPTYEQMVDSVRGAGGTLSAGGVRYWLAPGRVGAMQVHVAPRGGGGAVVKWVSLAAGARAGAGRSVGEAWANLRGTSVPPPPGFPLPGSTAEARRWFLAADSAFRRGDFAAFGRAFEALRALLEAPPAPPK